MNGWTPLHNACCYRGNSDPKNDEERAQQYKKEECQAGLVNVLLEAGANPRAVAVRQGCVQVVFMLPMIQLNENSIISIFVSLIIQTGRVCTGGNLWDSA